MPDTETAARFLAECPALYHVSQQAGERDAAH
jgi:hypothetical protein